MFLRLATLTFFFLLLGLSQTSAGESEDDAERRAIGQHIIAGFFGTKDTDPGFRQTLENLERGTIGGVLFLGRNISDKSELEQMVRAIIQCKCRDLPFIAIDEEGGAIERLGKQQGYKSTPSAAMIGQGSVAMARNEFRQLAMKLVDAGFNMNLAPVVDLNINPENPIIGSLGRSFSNEPKVVGTYASIFIEEHHKRGIATVLKHFPGHGSSSTDSHDGISDVQGSLSLS